MSPILKHPVLAVLLLTFGTVSAQETKPTPPPAPADATKAADKEPPLPAADAHVEQTIQLDGKALRYTVTVGALPVYAQLFPLCGRSLEETRIVQGRLA